VNNITDSYFIRSASDMRCKPKPTVVTPAPEPLASEEPTPEEPAPEADTTLPDLPPPSPNKPKPGLVVRNKSRPLKPLLQMAQVSV
jgi:hypothetical protein